ncbi:MAG: transposase [Deltaproteobacteria bacterium]|nr:transposase [Deltaproteobacteria bacterium]
MARKPRIEFPGACYHVLTRGNHRQVIFHDAADRAYYLERLEHYRHRYRFRLYAYVLMANHVHLLLETGVVPLAKIMQGLQFTYTRYYNRRYRKVGHLFQGRYQAILVDRDTYLRELVRYVHLNPARLRPPGDPRRYPWSSHRAYLGEPSPVKVETALVLGQFGSRVGRARHAYGQFMAAGRSLGHQGKYYETVDQRFLGDPRFVAAVQRQVRGARESAGGPPVVAFPRLVQAVAQMQHLEPQALLRSDRRRVGGNARAMLVYLAREWGGLSTKELGRRLQRDPSLISRLYAAYAAKRDRQGEAQLAKELRQ